MPLTEPQLARQRLAGLIGSGGKPVDIERARADLEYVKAQQSITSWTLLNLMQRARLAALLLAGDTDAS